MVEDGKAVYAYDRANAVEPQPLTEYFLRAIKGVLENKQHYANAEARVLAQPRSPFAGMMGSFAAARMFGRDNDDD